ncbi:MAG TPA: DUF2723 domain-containing protein [Thermoanaerobaculia bacterium]|nr:DUF2723 domain-containing protein [Thermoanaerobaculia bacterium]
MTDRAARLVTTVAVFLIALGVYVKTLAPTVALVDSGALTIAAWDLGVAHPPGFPLWVMLTHLFTALPLGSIAVRANLASAFFAALACAMTALAVGEVTKRWQAMFFAGLLLTFARTLWGYATVTEVYALNTFLIATIIWFMLSWRNTKQMWRLYAAAAVFGLALGVHHVTVGLTLIGIAVLVFRTVSFDFFKSRVFFIAAAIAIASLVAVYAYLPIAAARGPLLNWGDPETGERFVRHITAAQYRAYINTNNQGSQVDDIARYAGRELGPPWMPLALLLAVYGFLAAWRRDRTLFWLLLLLFGAACAWMLIYPIVNDEDAYLLPAFLALNIAAGFGAATLGEKRSWIPLALLALPLLAAIVHWPYRDRSRFYVAHDYADNALKTMDRNALLFTGDWELYSPLFYVLEAEKPRRDVTAMQHGMLIRTWYVESLQRRYPELMRKVMPELDALHPYLVHFERDDAEWHNDPTMSQTMNAKLDDLILAIIHQQIAAGGHVYATHDVAMSTDPLDQNMLARIKADYDIVPRGIVLEYVPGHALRETRLPKLELRGLADGTVRYEPDDVVVTEVIPSYRSGFYLLGRYLGVTGKYDEAEAAYKQALVLDPENPNIARELQQLELARAMRK